MFLLILCLANKNYKSKSNYSPLTPNAGKKQKLSSRHQINAQGTNHNSYLEYCNSHMKAWEQQIEEMMNKTQRPRWKINPPKEYQKCQTYIQKTLKAQHDEYKKQTKLDQERYLQQLQREYCEKWHPNAYCYMYPTVDAYRERLQGTYKSPYSTYKDIWPKTEHPSDEYLKDYVRDS